MISDQERRELAARLRELAAQPDPDGDVYYGDLVDCGLLQWGTYIGHVTQESVERLADLVDRKTCRFSTDTSLNGTLYGSFGTCTNCGAKVDPRAAFWNNDRFSPPNFCPCCGAEVVRDD